MHLIPNSFQLYCITKSYAKQNCITRNYIINISLSEDLYKFVYFYYDKIYKIE